MPNSYMFYCKKCGFNKEVPTKQDWHLEKLNHKRRGCEFEEAPHLNRSILARPELAYEARAGKKMVEEELHSGTITLELENEHDDLTSGQDEHIPEGHLIVDRS